MKKTFTLFMCALLAIVSVVPASTISASARSGAFEVKDVPNTIFAPLDGLATIEYSSEGQYSGNPGEEFITDEDDPTAIRSNNRGMRSSTVKITITFGENISADFGFDYKVSSENNYDYLQINGAGKIGGEVDWTAYTQKVTSGTVVTMAYLKDSSTDRGSDCAWFKNFTLTPNYAVTFTNLDENATLIVRSSDNAIVAPASAGVYNLSAGNYTYSVSCFGYVAQNGTFEVRDSGFQIELPEMVLLDSCSIRFNTTPSDAAVVLRHEMTGELSPVDGIYTVPVGEVYSYIVSADSYIPVNGSFVAEGDETIDVTLEYAGEAWDGTTVSEPEFDIAQDAYVIGTAAELEWFASYVNAGHEDVNAILTQNINYNGKVRTSIGIYDYSDDDSGYNGTFDGRGFAVIGIIGEGGFAECIGPNGAIKNLNVNVNVTGNGNIGGIADTSKGLVENCLVNGSLTNSSNYASTGGIVGRAMTGNTVRGCVNNASINNVTDSFASTLSTGGIVGYTYGVVENCYNTGAVSAKPEKTTNKGIGGIAGQIHASGAITNAYNIGSVTGPEAGIGSIVGVYKGSLENAYTLEGVCPNFYCENQTGSEPDCHSLSSEQMRSVDFVTALGGSFNMDTEGINNGYPVIDWQGGWNTLNPIEEALALYPSLVRDFVDKSMAVDMNALTDDVQLPTPSALEDAGVLTDRPNQRVVMESMNSDVFEFYGYHGIVYRALPDGEPLTVEYRISIVDRNTNETLGSRVFTLTVLPFTEEELTAAETLMGLAVSNELYWNCIKNANPDKENVTADLDPFVELIPNDEGGFDVVRGTVNMTFGGIQVDDLPGYNPMGSQGWRTFRSSSNVIIAHENLLVTRPSYDTEVTVDSVLSYTKYAKYWEKFSEDSDYARFEQFYKQPVSATVTVKGTMGSDPSDIEVTVTVNGRNFNGFENIIEAVFTGDGAAAWSVYDAIQGVLNDSGYRFMGDGMNIPAVTDASGTVLSGGMFGETSGWYCRLNGVLLDAVTLGAQIVNDGDAVEFFYTDDYFGEGVTTLIGDANGDGVVDIADAVYILRSTMNVVPLTAKLLANGDVNGDGVINAGDALCVLRFACGIAEMI